MAEGAGLGGAATGGITQFIIELSSSSSSSSESSSLADLWPNIMIVC